MQDTVPVCDRAQDRRRRVALVVLGVAVAAAGIWGVTAGREPQESVPLTLAPAWMPPSGAPRSTTPEGMASPETRPTGPEQVELGTETGDGPAPATRRPTSRPPAASATPVAPLLTVTAGAVPGDVDLTREGTRDWVHWGLHDGESVDRKSGVTPLIQDLGSPGRRGRYDNNPQLFTWSDGSPSRSATRTPTGVYTCGQGGGFVVQVPAGPAVSTVRLYAGVWMGRGRLTVTLNGAAASRTLENLDAISTSRYEIRFRAATGSRLTMTWTATAVSHPTCGNVDMQAVTLS
ncbi:hypothetical protein [Paractinoplanes toevensis]|uniref:Uncharacterized protein n=1 Tax=Paractinoplanes toevensis TaxID=571911 RepID=A0A919T5I7_9ACTN|nr:hypothetical protein [Actinoplanes toevensis]GIM89754.1 hypothetical protein Ato02nite_015470 [Actinoplanes toevensis]